METKTDKPKKFKPTRHHSAYSFVPTDEAVQQILRERGEQLSKKKETEETSKTLMPYILIRLGEKELYGIPYFSLQEVLQKVNLTHVPFVPDYISGVINRHGRLLTVLDIQKYLHLNDQPLTNDAPVIIVKSKTLTMGIMVNYIVGSDVYNPAELTTALSSSGAIKPEYIMGLHEGTKAILNVEKILGDIEAQFIKRV